MSTHANAQVESTDTQLDARTQRALTESMSVLPEGGDIYTVVGENGGTYTVDDREGRCTCPDHQHRGARCKHQRRVAFAVGRRPVPASVEGVDDLLGEHTDGEVRTVAADGGRVVATGETTDRQRVPVAGGVLVYDVFDGDRELAGFAGVTDWDRLGDAVAAKGHDRGDVLHLPELDA